MDRRKVEDAAVLWLLSVPLDDSRMRGLEPVTTGFQHTVMKINGDDRGRCSLLRSLGSFNRLKSFSELHLYSK